MNTDETRPSQERQVSSLMHDDTLEAAYKDYQFKLYTNTEGRFYYFSSVVRVLTTDKLHDRTCRDFFVQQLDSKARDLHAANLRVPSDGVWHVEYNERTKGYDFHYASHGACKYVRIDFKDGTFTELDESENYLRFIKAFPHTCAEYPNPQKEAYFVSSLSFGAAERLFNDRETVFPFTEQECQTLLCVYGHLKKGQSTPQMKENETSRVLVDRTLVWLIASIGVEVEKGRRDYNWGTIAARTHRDLPDARFISSNKLRMLDVLLSTISFGMHATYRTRLLSTRYKGKVHMPDFQKLITGLLREWADSNLLATVLVSANVAFLAVPNVLDLQKTASIASTIFGMISILIGVHHNWRHRSHFDTEVEVHPREGSSYKAAVDRYLRHLESSCGRELGVTIQAFFLSMPISLLLWAVVSFVIAISAFGIQKAEIPTRNVSISVLSILTLVAILNIAYFWKIWYEKEPYLDDPEDEEDEEGAKGMFSTMKDYMITAKERVKSRSVEVERFRARFRQPVQEQVTRSDNIELAERNT